MNYIRLKELIIRMERLEEAVVRYQRIADNANGFTSETGVRHARAHVAVLRRDYTAAMLEARGTLA